MTWIGSNRNRRIDFLKPDPAEIDIEDIADGLATAFRFRGLTSVPYTVAQHCALASFNCEHPLEALLHDAHEAYMGDVPRPLKKLLGREWYEIENRLQAAIATKFGISAAMRPEVKLIDDILLATEHRDLQPNSLAWTIDLPRPLERINLPWGWQTFILPWGQDRAREVWMIRFDELMCLRNSSQLQKGTVRV